LCLVHSTYGGLLARYDENGNSNNVKVMNRVGMLFMGCGSSTTHKDVCDIDLARWCIQGCDTLATCLEV